MAFRFGLTATSPGLDFVRRRHIASSDSCVVCRVTLGEGASGLLRRGGPNIEWSPAPLVLVARDVPQRALSGSGCVGVSVRRRKQRRSMFSWSEVVVRA